MPTQRKAAMSVRMPKASAAALLLIAAMSACRRGPAERYDVVITGGTVYDGTGAPGIRADVGVVGDEIKTIGDLSAAQAGAIVRADGLAVAPGFVNMMSGDD